MKRRPLFPAAILTLTSFAALFFATKFLSAAPPDASPAAPIRLPFEPGERLTVKKKQFVVERTDGARLTLRWEGSGKSLTVLGGRIVAPVDLTASSHTNETTPQRLTDGSGLSEDPVGSGVFVHTNQKFADGGTMWNAGYDEGTRATLTFDLGEELSVLGLHVWNYNEEGYEFRGVKDFELEGSADGKAYTPAGKYALAQAGGTDDYGGEDVAFPAPVKGRYVRMRVVNNHGNKDVVGLSEVRFRVEGKADQGRVVSFPKYPRPQHPKLAVGQPLRSAENIAFPADAGVTDVSKAPYNAKGDGITDDTAAIQAALDQHRGIIYLPNGRYLVSDTLKWGLKNGWPASYTTLQGQSRDGTVLVLKDHAPRYQDARRPKALVWTGEGSSADRFANNIQVLTLDTGVGSPGACGAQYISNNMGTLADVTIISGDGQGAVGLDMAYTNLVGPLLVTNLKVVGFDYGVKAAGVVNSQTLEHLTLESQNVCGLFNGGQTLSVRGLTSRNSVPAVENRSGLLVLLDGALTGTGAAATGPAVLNGGSLYARKIQTSGYCGAIRNTVGSKVGVTGATVEEFTSEPPSNLFPSPNTSLGLPVKETPRVAWGEPKDWVSPQKFATDLGEMKKDATAAIQAAIDSGAGTIYLPAGQYKVTDTVLVRGKVRHIIGCRADLDALNMDKPAFKLVDAVGGPKVVVIERINGGYTPTPVFDNASSRTLVIKNCINTPCTFTGTGDSFLEDVCSNPQAGFRFGRGHVWARQMNPENQGTHVLNDGGTLWVLGLKTERGGTIVETRDGGKTEVLGGFSYTTSAGKLAPMFVVDNSSFSAAFGEVCFNGDPFATLVSETRQGQTRVLKPGHGMTAPLFVGSATSGGKQPASGR